MDYGAGVWGFSDFMPIEIVLVQNRAMRFFLSVNKYASIHALYGDLGWIMPRYRRWISMIQMWNHFVQMSNSRMAKQIFLWDRDLCTDKWSADINEICAVWSRT